MRHGEPEWVRGGLNVVDPPLTERGQAQAEQLAQVLAKEDFDEVLVSPLVRARQTAAPLLAPLGRDEEVDPWLEEIRDPKWHGTPAEKAADAYAELRGRPAEERWSGLDGGESVREFVARIRSGAAGFLAERGVDAQRGGAADLADRGARRTDPARRPRRHELGAPSAICSACRRRRGSGTASCSGTPRSAGSKRCPCATGYTFCLSKLSDVEHLPLDDRTR